MEIGTTLAYAPGVDKQGGPHISSCASSTVQKKIKTKAQRNNLSITLLQFFNCLVINYTKIASFAGEYER